MPHRYTRQISMAGLCLLLVFTFATGGCGKKGPLYLPPADKPAPEK